MRSIADFRRAAVIGSRWMCINRHLPHVSGLRTITGGTSALRYTGVRLDGTGFANGRLDIPKAAEVRIEGDSLHMLSEPGSDRVIWTWTLLSPTVQGEALKPPPVFAACPVREKLRGPAGKPWCVYDTVYDRPVDADGLPGTDDTVYFASQTEAEALAARLWPRGAEFDMYGIVPPTGDWAYVVDSTGVVYGDGPWPFHDDKDGGPRSVRLSPDTTYYSWRNEYVGIWPRRFGRAETTLNLYVRRRGGGAVTVRCKVTFDLLANTFSIADSCPPQLREQATSKAQKIVDLIKFARQERDTYVQPWTAGDQYATDQAATKGEPRPAERPRRDQPLPNPTGVPADVLVVQQGHGVWQRVGPDEWLTAEGGDAQRPTFYRYDTAGMLRFGAVQPLTSPALTELERLGAAMAGRTITVPPGQSGYRRWDLTVQHAEKGFLYGPGSRGHREVVHLAVSGLYDAGPAQELTDRAGRAIRVGDQVHEYTNERIGPQKRGLFVGAYQVVGVDEAARVLFTDRYAEKGQPEAVAFPDDVEVVPGSVVSASGVTAPLTRITKTEARRRWGADELVAVTNERYPDGHPGFAMQPSRFRSQFSTFDAMVAQSTDTRRPAAVYFSKPDSIFGRVVTANAVQHEQSGDIWMRVSTDEWLQITSDSHGRPQRHVVTTADLFRLGALQVIHTHETAASCERATAELVGRHVLVHSPRAGDVHMRVLDTTGGFLTGITAGGEPIVIHLLDTTTTQLAGPSARPDSSGPVPDELPARG